jgi:exopolyphosphatase/guanosine-5'-triphosphate,3'-diphosphate pyrophosphatase
MAEPLPATPLIAPAPARVERRAPVGPIYGALDLGTNNCRLLLATPARQGFRVQESFSRIVRLGEGLAASGRLSETAQARALEALHVCAQRLARHPVQKFRAVATEACRRAANGAAFIAQARRETGLAIEIISTREEAELAIESCLALLADHAQEGERRALLFDIGGGSTEVALVRLSPDRRPDLAGYASLPAGVIALAERFGPGSRDPECFPAMVEYVAGLLAPFEAVHRVSDEVFRGGVRLLGTSGTVTTLAGVALDLPCYRRAWVDGVTLETDVTDLALEKILALDAAGIAAHPCIGPDRAEFVLPGCAVYAAIRELWPAPKVTIADRGLREGILLRLMAADRNGHFRRR